MLNVMAESDFIGDKLLFFGSFRSMSYFLSSAVVSCPIYIFVIRVMRRLTSRIRAKRLKRLQFGQIPL